MEMTRYTIDAEGRSIGRIASEAASLLIGKKIPSAAKHLVPSVFVTVVNAKHTRMTEKKQNEKIYVTYSGYPAGIKRTTLSTKIAKHGVRDVIREAVWGMLPKNKLRARMIKNLTVTE